MKISLWNKTSKTAWSLVIILLGALFSLCATAQGAPAKVGPKLQSVLDAALQNELVPVIITMTDKVSPSLLAAGPKKVHPSEIITALKAKAEMSQGHVLDFLRNTGVKHTKSLWIINGIAAKVPTDLVSTLSLLPEVESVRLDATIQAPEVTVGQTSPAEWNINAIKAPALWNMGANGTGIVVANMDTGVDPDHPDLSGSWRGGTNSWFDPYGEHPAVPYDNHGHGTATMSIIVGGENGGSAIGVAPGAQWIAAKIFNDAGNATYSAIHQGFQWLLDPDGDPATDDAPDIVNNSWGLEAPGVCVPEFQPDVQTLKAAGIVLVFSAGNSGPSPSTDLSPANYPESFAVGAVDDALTVAPFSSIGPSACDGTIFPELVAPGVNVKTADLTFGGAIPNSYAYVAGTSFAAPHVAGAVALLMSHPDLSGLSIEDIELALKTSAADLTLSGPDNDYGYGLIDTLEAFNDAYSVAVNATQPEISAWPSSNDFGCGRTDDSSAPVSFTVFNGGMGDLNISSVSFTGTDPSDFVLQADNCTGLVLAPLETCGISVVFAPLTGGTKNAEVSISSSDPLTPNVEIPLTGFGISAVSPPMETGTIFLDHNWQPVTLANTFCNPVVVAKPLSMNDNDPSVVRMRNVTPGGFEIRVQEWDYLDGLHAQETVSYLVMEEGSYVLENGARVEAGAVATNKADANQPFAPVNFSSAFSESPVIISSVITRNDPDAVTTRNKEISTTGFKIIMQEQEANAPSHSTETLDYIAWTPGSGTIGELDYQIGIAVNATDSWITLGYGPFTDSPALLVDMQTTNGHDTANLKFRNKGTASVELQVSEETSRDAETFHVAESAGYFALGNLQAPVPIFETGTVQIDHNWQTVPLSKTFNNPVVIAKPLSKNGGDPAVVRLKNVTPSSFDIRVQEWNYLDQWHLPETVSYMVMEAGHYVLDNGLHVEAGTVSTNKADANNPFKAVIFASPFPAQGDIPVVATTVMTYNGHDTVTTRNRNVSRTGFEVVMQEQEGLDHVHVTETIGYIAWEPGTGTTDGTTYEVALGGAFTHQLKTLSYSDLGSPTPPVLIMDMQTANGRDTANLRYINKGPTSVSVQVHEEKSRDTETLHIPEEIGYFAFQ